MYVSASSLFNLCRKKEYYQQVIKSAPPSFTLATVSDHAVSKDNDVKIDKSGEANV